MIQKVRNFTDSTNFSNALKVTLASAIPVLLFSYTGNFQIGFNIALGAFLTYPSDIPSNRKHRINGILVAALIVAGNNLLVNLLYPLPWILYPAIAVMIFFFSMISVYGQRATQVSFSALLSICLAFGHIHEGWEMLQYSGLMLVGGLFYLAISLTFNYIRPHRYAELQIAECIRLTSKYMKLRGDLWKVDSPREKIIEKQLYLQVELNTIHENLREILIRNRSNSNGTSDQTRKMTLVFISLMEILELALSTSFDHNKLHQKFADHPKVLATYQNLAYNLASSLKAIFKSIESHKKYIPKHSLLKDLEALEKVISDYEQELGKEKASEGVWMLSNMLHYAEKQIEKIKIVERAFMPNFNSNDYKGRDKNLDKLLTPQYYPWSTLRENLSFSSTIFRHSLRLTSTIMIAFLIGSLFPFQNVYWILLTIVVIMRPGYGLTKERSFHRIIGTVAGGLIAFALLLFVQNHIIIGALAITAMILGFTFTSINYKIGATFVTIYVVFVYGIITPNINDVIQYRILDTVVGAGLAFLANYFFWPSWEFMSQPIYIKKSIEANRDYLNEISLFYNNKGDVTTSYRIARKNAFIEIGNLMASFQRMTQEPKSKQKQVQQVYKLAVLNHTLLSSLASLGTYIQTHKTSKASEAFNVVVQTVIKNLNYAITFADLEITEKMANSDTNEDLAMRFTELKNMRAKELKEAHLSEDDEFQLKMQEAQLVIEQLVWLTNLSESIVKASKQLHQTK
ncbi:putative membrane protein (TIGR01666 family) [Flavobacterium endophyticum]|uniref:Putative membrane protein (TIGR01666 family) n=1 Tax=Flavobacterium endophyticum TaxID=1540163 RepID=A0A495MKG7_9FLAO|nr:FUSC family membrane protein [Flavobacterium endophyticum]RKS25353.1 putative membrane protein (TIGR01666 family) [Flavobacterium endophyticum]